MTFRETAGAGCPSAASLGESVIASDVRYFELGARIESVAGARLAWMPGLADLPAGCVVVDAEAWRERADPGQELDAVEKRVRALGGRVRLNLRARARARIAGRAIARAARRLMASPAGPSPRER